jgi:hypothetical protein
MAATFTKIATVTVGSGGVSTIDFSSIPTTYTDLCLKVSLRSDVTGGGRDYFALRFNANSSDYSWRWLYGYDSGTVGSNSGSAQTYQKVFTMTDSQTTANTFGNAEVYIPNYASSNYKSSSGDSVAENNSTATYMLVLNAGLWSNTAAINQITIYPNNGGSGNFVQYSTATLYGIKNS